jgi:hypothetical protein
MPQGESVWNLGEAKHFLDPAVAVGRNDEDRAGKVGRACWNPHDDVVMKLTLPPVIDEFVSIPSLTNPIKECTKDERVRQVRHNVVLNRLHPARIAHDGGYSRS